jgi:hypothetical protein
MSTPTSNHLRDMAHSARAAIAKLATLPDRLAVGPVDVWALGRAREALIADAEKHEQMLRECLKEEQLGVRA